MKEFEDFLKIVNFLTEKKGIMKKNIAQRIGVNPTSFSQAVSGERITKRQEYALLIAKHYESELKDMGKDMPELGQYVTQDKAWNEVLKKQDEILKNISLILEHIQK